MVEREESGDLQENHTCHNAINRLSFTASQNDKDGEAKDDTVAKRYTSTQWITLVTLAFGNFCIGACVSLQAPFFPKEAEAKGATPTEYGLIFGAYQLTIFITAPVVGKLLPYVVPKRVLNVGILTIGISAVLFGTLDLVPNGTTFVALAFAVRIVEGVGAATLKTSICTIIASEFKGNMTTTFGVLETFAGVGLITGPTVGGVLYDVGGYGLPFFSMGGLLLVDAVIIYVVLPNSAKCEHEKKADLLKFWFNPGILIYALTVFSTFNILGFMVVSLEPHLRPFHLSGSMLGLVFALAGGTYAFSATFWGWLGDKKVEYKLLIFIGCCLSLTAVMLYGPLPFFKMEPRLDVILVALVLLGLAAGAKLVSAFGGSLEDTIARGFPADTTTYALVSSMFASSQSLGAFVGPSLGGYLLEKIEVRMTTLFFLGLEIFLMILLSTYICVKKCRGSKLTDGEKKPLVSRNQEQQGSCF